MSYAVRKTFAQGLKLPFIMTASDKERLRREQAEKRRIRNARRERNKTTGIFRIM